MFEITRATSGSLILEYLKDLQPTVLSKFKQLPKTGLDYRE
jgi:hypothetical protein